MGAKGQFVEVAIEEVVVHQDEYLLIEGGGLVMWWTVDKLTTEQFPL